MKGPLAWDNSPAEPEVVIISEPPAMIHGEQPTVQKSPRKKAQKQAPEVVVNIGESTPEEQTPNSPKLVLSPVG